MLSPNQINRYNWTHQLFRNEFSKHHDVVYYGDGFPNYIPEKPISELIKEYDNKFDLIITYGLKYTLPFKGLGEITDIPKAHIAVDYFPKATSGTYEWNHKLFNRDKYDIYFGVYGHVVKNLVKNGVCKKAHLNLFSVDTEIYKKINCAKKIDVFCGAFSRSKETYPMREEIIHYIKRMDKNINVYSKKIVHQEYVKKINESKICITSNNIFNSPSIKYFEFLSCGSFMLANEPEDLFENGFIKDKHLVIYNDLKDLDSKIRFFLKNDSIRENIARQGMELVRKYHNNSIRVTQFINTVKKELDI